MDERLTDLLGGAARGRTRQRGFITWNPQPQTRELLGSVATILVEYQNFLPLTIRQIFYRLVGAHDYEKTELAYGRLGEILNKARRARLISMYAIRDDGGANVEPTSYDGPDAFIDVLRSIIDDYRRDRSEGQATKLILVCEAAGMVPQLASVGRDYGVSARSSGGFESLGGGNRAKRSPRRDPAYRGP